jgi:hypothetical protein
MKIEGEHLVDIKWWQRELGVCRRSVERYIDIGLIPQPVRLGGWLMRWSRKVAEAHLDKMGRDVKKRASVGV